MGDGGGEMGDGGVMGGIGAMGIGLAGDSSTSR
jgi:hypothetical protein